MGVRTTFHLPPMVLVRGVVGMAINQGPLMNDKPTNTTRLERKPGCDCWVTADCQFCGLHRRSVETTEQRIVEWLDSGAGWAEEHGIERQAVAIAARAIERGEHRG